MLIKDHYNVIGLEMEMVRSIEKRCQLIEVYAQKYTIKKIKESCKPKICNRNKEGSKSTSRASFGGDFEDKIEDFYKLFLIFLCLIFYNYNDDSYIIHVYLN